MKDVIKLVNDLKESKNYIVKVVTLYPKDAIELLKTNVSNRQISQATVEDWKKAILNNWRLTNDAIAFNNRGVLSNGQHRLTALAELDGQLNSEGSLVSIEAIVICGIPEENFTVMDTGRSRSGADTLHTEGVNDSSKISSCIKSFVKTKSHFEDAVMMRSRITNTQVLELWNSNRDLFVDCVNISNKFLKNIRQAEGTNLGLVFSTISGYSAYLLSVGIEIEKIEKFWNIISRADGARDFDQPMFARTFRSILRESHKSRKDSLKRECLLNYLSIAWNYYITGFEGRCVFSTKDSVVRPIKEKTE